MLVCSLRFAGWDMDMLETPFWSLLHGGECVGALVGSNPFQPNSTQNCRSDQNWIWVTRTLEIFDNSCFLPLSPISRWPPVSWYCAYAFDLTQCTRWTTELAWSPAPTQSPMIPALTAATPTVNMMTCFRTPLKLLDKQSAHAQQQIALHPFVHYNFDILYYYYGQ